MATLREVLAKMFRKPAPPAIRRTPVRLGLETLEVREVPSVANGLSDPLSDSPLDVADVARVRKVVPPEASDPDDTLKEATRLGAVGPNWSVGLSDSISLRVPAVGANGKRLSWGEYALENARDVDVYQFRVGTGDRVRFEVETRRAVTTWLNPASGKAESKDFQAAVRMALFSEDGKLLNSEGGDPAVTTPLRPVSEPANPERRDTYAVEYTFHRPGLYYLAVSNFNNSTYNLKTGRGDGPPPGYAAFGPYQLSGTYVRKDLPDYVAVSAEVTSKNFVTLRYRNDGVDAAAYGPAKAAVYKSAYPEFDPATAELVTTVTIPARDLTKTSATAPGLHDVTLPPIFQGSDKTSATALPDPFQPYLFVKIDPSVAKAPKAWPDQDPANGTVVELSESNNVTAVDNSRFRVQAGQFTFNAEIGAGEKHLRPHWPGGASGVTIGIGYDMRERTRDQVYGDLRAAGVDDALASDLAAGAGLTSSSSPISAAKFAGDWLNAGKPGLTHEQARNLFNGIYPDYVAKAEVVYDRWTSENGVPLLGKTAWADLKPAIRDTLVDLIYQGINYNPAYTATGGNNPMYLDPARNPMRQAMGNDIAPLVAVIESEPRISQYENNRRRADFLRRSLEHEVAGGVPDTNDLQATHALTVPLVVASPPVAAPAPLVIIDPTSSPEPRSLAAEERAAKVNVPKGIQAVLLSRWSDPSVDNLITVLKEMPASAAPVEIAFAPHFGNAGTRYDHILKVIDELAKVGKGVRVTVHLGFHDRGDVTDPKSPLKSTLAGRAESLNTFLTTARMINGQMVAPIDVAGVQFVVSPSLEDNFATYQNFEDAARLVAKKFTEATLGKLTFRRSSVHGEEDDRYRPVDTDVPTNKTLLNVITSDKKKVKQVALQHEYHGLVGDAKGYTIFSNDGVFVRSDGNLDGNNPDESDKTENAAGSETDEKPTLDNWLTGKASSVKTSLLWRPSYNLFTETPGNGFDVDEYARPLVKDPKTGKPIKDPKTHKFVEVLPGQRNETQETGLAFDYLEQQVLRKYLGLPLAENPPADPRSLPTTPPVVTPTVPPPDVLSPPVSSPPIAPANLRVTAIGSRVVTLTWNDRSGDETAFRVAASRDNGATWDNIAVTGPNATSARIDGLAPRSHVLFKVRAAKGELYSDYTPTVAADTPGEPPAAPANLRTTDVWPLAVGLAWDDRSGTETEFRVAISRDGGVSWDNAGVTAANVTSLRVEGLTPGTRYLFKVRAADGAEYSDYSNTLDIATRGLPPAAPDHLRVVNSGPRHVTVGWTDRAADETGFRVYVSTDGSHFTSYGDDPANFEAHYVAGLQPETRYWLLVRSFNANGESADSPVLEFRTEADLRPPVAPGNLRTSDVWPRAAQLHWDDLSGDETEFRVAISRDGGVSWDNAAVTGPNVTSVRVSGLDPNTRILVKVRAAGPGGYSEYSNMIEFVTPSELPPAPSAPSALTLENLWPSRADVRWGAGGGAISAYRVAISRDGMNWDNAVEVGADRNSYRVEGLAPSTRIWVKVRAVGPGGYSDYSNTIEFVTPSGKPAAPANPRVANTWARTVDLNWDRVADADWVTVFRSADGVNFVEIGAVRGDEVRFRVENLRPNTRYWFRLQSNNQYGNSAFSAVVPLATRAA